MAAIIRTVSFFLFHDGFLAADGGADELLEEDDPEIECELESDELLEEDATTAVDRMGLS
jgi:hypothetical protein